MACGRRAHVAGGGSGACPAHRGHGVRHVAGVAVYARGGRCGGGRGGGRGGGGVAAPAAGVAAAGV
eukprot:124169-Prymnesium_polylepis.1